MLLNEYELVECTDGAQRSSLKKTNGNIWFCSEFGVLIFSMVNVVFILLIAV
jgi:hypothetical protein